jgi:hypothetical protein
MGTGVLARGVKVAIQFHLITRLRKGRAILLFPLYAYMMRRRTISFFLFLFVALILKQQYSYIK